MSSNVNETSPVKPLTLWTGASAAVIYPASLTSSLTLSPGCSPCTGSKISSVNSSSPSSSCNVTASAVLSPAVVVNTTKPAINRLGRGEALRIDHARVCGLSAVNASCSSPCSASRMVSAAFSASNVQPLRSNGVPFLVTVTATSKVSPTDAVMFKPAGMRVICAICYASGSACGLSGQIISCGKPFCCGTSRKACRYGCHNSLVFSGTSGN